MIKRVGGPGSGRRIFFPASLAVAFMIRGNVRKIP
jgi:hypothetical protein